MLLDTSAVIRYNLGQARDADMIGGVSVLHKWTDEIDANQSSEDAGRAVGVAIDIFGVNLFRKE